jgi:hypothetical protein
MGGVSRLDEFSTSCLVESHVKQGLHKDCTPQKQVGIRLNVLVMVIGIVLQFA